MDQGQNSKVCSNLLVSDVCKGLATAIRVSAWLLAACKLTGADCTTELENLKLAYQGCIAAECPNCGENPDDMPTGKLSAQ